jgi:hypothetical protein
VQSTAPAWMIPPMFLDAKYPLACTLAQCKNMARFTPWVTWKIVVHMRRLGESAESLS